MTTTVAFEAKELKEILKTFAKFASFSVQRPTITFTFEPLKMVMSTDNAYVLASPVSAKIQGDPLVDYSFDPTTLLNLVLLGDDVALSWDSETSNLSVVSGNLRTSLRVAVPTPEFHAIPSEMPSVKIPYGVLSAGTRFLSIPFSFHDEKKELMPVRFYSEKGKLTMAADDQFSLAKITTDIDVDKEFDVKVPKFILDCLYAKTDFKDTTSITTGVGKTSTMFSNKVFQIYAAGVVKDTSNFDTVIEGFKAKTSCSFKPKSLSTAIKPLAGLIPKKNDDTVLTVTLEESMTLGIKHREIGEGQVDNVGDVADIYNENSLRSYKINMFPKAFEDYTKLFAVEQGKMYADERMVYYQGEIESGGALLDINYIFPVVAV